MIIAVVGEKGGVGKTTLSTNFAVLRAIEKGEALLVDGDLIPHSSYWSLTRDKNGISPKITCIEKTGEGLRHDVLALSKKHSEIVIDVGGRDSPELRAALLVRSRQEVEEPTVGAR